MKAGSVGLWLSAAVLAYLGWILFDMFAAPPSLGPDGKSPIAIVRTADVPVLVEFYADWCGPCKIVAPEVAKLTAELDGQAKVIRINIDEERSVAAVHRVRAVPTFIAFRDGKETARQSGAIPRSQMKAMLGL